MAFVSECLKPIVGVGDDDSTLIGDAQSLRKLELAWLIAFGAELEQERAIDRRQYLHSIVEGITDDDSMSIIVDRNACWTIELARLRSLLADGEQEREIDRRQEHQPIVVGIDDDDATMMLVDRNASRIVELEISWSKTADARQERLLAQWPWLYSIIAVISDEDAITFVIDRKAPWPQELAWLVAILAELGHERQFIITREYLHSIVVAIAREQEVSMMVEHQAKRVVEHASIAWLLGADRELDSSITIKSIVFHLFHFNLSHTTTKRSSKLQTAQTKETKKWSSLSLSRDTRETPSKQASKQATSNKNQSMKEQRTATHRIKQ